MEDTDWRPSPCPTCGQMREARENLTDEQRKAQAIKSAQNSAQMLNRYLSEATLAGANYNLSIVRMPDLREGETFHCVIVEEVSDGRS